jgi:putative endonuclease
MNKFSYVYILFSQIDQKLYIGFTSDLISRLKEHQNEKVTATKKRLPVTLIHYEVFKNTKETKARERYLKSRYGRKKFEKGITEYIQKDKLFIQIEDFQL